jgi:hypothetical protein
MIQPIETRFTEFVSRGTFAVNLYTLGPQQGPK